jgi:hypothetical protein
MISLSGDSANPVFALSIAAQVLGIPLQGVHSGCGEILVARVRVAGVRTIAGQVVRTVVGRAEIVV